MDIEQKSRIRKVTVSGNDPLLWERLKPKLLDVLDKSLETIINYDTGATIKDEAKEFTSAMLEYGKEKLKKASIENGKLNAEIDGIYSKINKEKAETRKINAITDTINLNNKIKSLRISLGISKVLLLGSENNEDIIFLKRIDTFIEVLKDLKNTNEI